jgi:hypothetical protein
MSIASLYPSINPSLLLDFANSKVLDPRITFTRTTTATYYDGVTTAKAEENLLTYSQEFDNAAWSKADAAVTANATTAPDGTSTADSMIPSATNIEHNIGQSINYSSGSIIVSIYAKANGYNYLQINSGFDTSYVNFDITSGSASVTATSGANISGSIQDAGNGWYRCIITYTPSATGSFLLRFNIVNSGTAARRAAFLANGTSGVYLWGAQLEQRSSVTAYTATTSQAITNYIPVLQTAAAGQARFDHNPTTGESLGLLIEEARTNSLTYSADLGNAYWNNNNINVTTNTIIAPDGTLTGDKVAANTASGGHYSYPNAGIVVSAGTYTASIYAKAGERSRLLAALYSGSNYEMVQFDLSNGTILQEAVAGIASITSVGNGWYRCTVTRTLGAVTTYFSFGPYTNTTLSNLTVFPTYAGDGFNGIYVWGAQLEAGSFATSYIPTVASTVTRNADAASMTGTNFSSWFNNGEGTLYAEASTSAANTAKRFAQIDSGAESNRIQIAAEASGTTKNFAVVTNSSTQAYTPVSASYPVKVGAGYKVNDFGASFNGGAIQTDTSGTVPALSVMRFGAASDASENMNGCLRKVSYYPAKATSAQIVGLTT